MRRFFRRSFTVFLINILMIIYWTTIAFGVDKVPGITAEFGVLMDQETGTVLFDKNAHVKRPPASTTKIMTVLLALEKGDLNQVVKISPKAGKTGESSMHLSPGEVISLRSLVYGAMLRSGNDACVAIAEAVAGSEEAFVQMMNQRAREIGAMNSNFMNTNGLPNKNHYSTAYDLALITRTALGNEKFKKVVSTKEITAMAPAVFVWRRHMKNTNKLLWQYPWADGVKTGTTNEAGQCLVSSASKDGRQFIGVVLHSDDRFYDSRVLLDYGINNFYHKQLTTRGEYFETLSVKNGKADQVTVNIDKTIYGIFHQDKLAALEKRVNLKRNLSAPLKRGTKVGNLQYYLEGKKINECNLVLGEDVLEKSLWEKFLFYVKQKVS